MFIKNLFYRKIEALFEKDNIKFVSEILRMPTMIAVMKKKAVMIKV